jgi:hypothetical protein
MINLSQDIWLSGRDLNPEPPEYEAGVLMTGQRRSFSVLKVEAVHDSDIRTSSCDNLKSRTQIVFPCDHTILFFSYRL